MAFFRQAVPKSARTEALLQASVVVVVVITFGGDICGGGGGDDWRRPFKVEAAV